jgi:SAM-dependent methyltransferase
MKLCKVCDLPDWESDEFLSILDELDLSFGRIYKHRRHWEFAQGILGLRRLGCLTPDALALGVGAGKEHPIHHLANVVKKVHAIDIYGAGEFSGSDAPAEMLVHPEEFAPFPYREDHLAVQYIDGCALQYPDQCFDFIFSFSSIEHFGGHITATRSTREMARVLRPGGIAVITAELVLNDVAHPEFFQRDEPDKFIIRPSGLRLIEKVDFTISPSMIGNPLDLRTDISNTFPHIVLKRGPAVFTSVMMLLQK